MPNFCFYCKTQITSQNCTEEHIFLAGLGDKLKTKKVLCRDCNSLLGAVVDAPLINDLKPFVDFLMIKTREKNPNVIVTDVKSKREYLFNPSKNKYKLRRDYVDSKPEGHQLHINASFKDEKSAQHYIKKLKDKYPSINPSDINVKHTVSQPQIEVYLPINPSRYVLAILKMAIEFSLICGVPRRGVDYLIGLLRMLVNSLNSNPEFAKVYLEGLAEIIHPSTPIPEDMKLIPRKMQAKLYGEDGGLYCWISILGFYSYTIQLNNPNDVSMEISHSVCYNGDPNEFKSLYKFDN